LSLDGIGKRHDEIRGYPKNFKNFLLTYNRLKEMQAEIPKFKIGVHTTISKYNIANFFEIYEYVKKLNPDTFIFEIAEERREFLNIGNKITPSLFQYKQLIHKVENLIKEDYLKSRMDITRFIQAFKLQYYNLSAKTLQMKKQIIPCYAGFNSCQINPFGDVWPCSILADSKSFGNLRDYNYNFKKLWFSKQANEIRKILKERKCYCPLASVFYTSAPYDFYTILKIIGNLI
jgi:radical SAM protein with 4Fe4S-binding SPASM domain